jgi:hypothetical protein
VRTRLIQPLSEQLTAAGASDPDATAETLVACQMGVIAMRPGGLFPALTRADPEVIGALLDAAARSPAGPFPGEDDGEDDGDGDGDEPVGGSAGADPDSGHGTPDDAPDAPDTCRS